MPKYYAGIGSRKTPENIQLLETQLATKLDTLDYILRSGNADGSDKAFQKGSKNYLSYRADYYTVAVNNDLHKFDYSDARYTEALVLAEKLHPAWDKCSEYARKMHTRNVFQILGLQLKAPVEFVICWTPEGEVEESHLSIRTGGTATALRLAFQLSIPVYNLAYEAHHSFWSHWLTL
jgi:hypothetical protein